MIDKVYTVYTMEMCAFHIVVYIYECVYDKKYLLDMSLISLPWGRHIGLL